MKLREKFEKETGRTAMYQGDEVEKQPTKQYFEWLEKQLALCNVIERLTAMRPKDEDFPEFDKEKEKDPVYCVEWGMLKQRDHERRVYDKMINDLKNAL